MTSPGTNATSPEPEPQPEPPGWTFLTNHAYVLIVISANADMRVREIAEHVGITTRAAHSILADLVETGYVERHRLGRRNHYTVNDRQPLRHPLTVDQNVGMLIEVVTPYLETSREVAASR